MNNKYLCKFVSNKQEIESNLLPWKFDDHSSNDLSKNRIDNPYNMFKELARKKKLINNSANSANSANLTNATNHFNKSDDKINYMTGTGYIIITNGKKELKIVTPFNIFVLYSTISIIGSVIPNCNMDEIPLKISNYCYWTRLVTYTIDHESIDKQYKQTIKTLTNSAMKIKSEDLKLLSMIQSNNYDYYMKTMNDQIIPLTNYLIEFSNIMNENLYPFIWLKMTFDHVQHQFNLSSELVQGCPIYKIDKFDKKSNDTLIGIVLNITNNQLWIIPIVSINHVLTSSNINDKLTNIFINFELYNNSKNIMLNDDVLESTIDDIQQTIDNSQQTIDDIQQTIDFVDSIEVAETVKIVKINDIQQTINFVDSIEVVKTAETINTIETAEIVKIINTAKIVETTNIVEKLFKSNELYLNHPKITDVYSDKKNIKVNDRLIKIDDLNIDINGCVFVDSLDILIPINTYAWYFPKSKHKINILRNNELIVVEVKSESLKIKIKPYINTVTNHVIKDDVIFCDLNLLMIEYLTSQKITIKSLEYSNYMLNPLDKTISSWMVVDLINKTLHSSLIQQMFEHYNKFELFNIIKINNSKTTNVNVHKHFNKLILADSDNNYFELNFTHSQNMTINASKMSKSNVKYDLSNSINVSNILDIETLIEFDELKVSETSDVLV